MIQGIVLSSRDRSDLRMLAWGAYQPLDRFTGELRIDASLG